MYYSLINLKKKKKSNVHLVSYFKIWLKKYGNVFFKTHFLLLLVKKKYSSKEKKLRVNINGGGTSALDANEERQFDLIILDRKLEN